MAWMGAPMITSGLLATSPVAGNTLLRPRNGRDTMLLPKPSGPVTIVPGPGLTTGARTGSATGAATPVRRTVSGRRSA